MMLTLSWDGSASDPSRIGTFARAAKYVTTLAHRLTTSYSQGTPALD